jgi:UDP-GlcNAc:undecaprenyl-phosphate GlcNAc-1-phosphate transferase
MLTLKFTRRQKGFKASPMDFLVVAIALVVPNMPLAELEPLNLGSLAVKIIVLFFGFDVLVGELRGKMGRLTALVLAGLAILGLRAVCGI